MQACVGRVSVLAPEVQKSWIPLKPCTRMQLRCRPSLLTLSRLTLTLCSPFLWSKTPTLTQTEQAEIIWRVLGHSWQTGWSRKT